MLWRDGLELDILPQFAHPLGLAEHAVEGDLRGGGLQFAKQVERQSPGMPKLKMCNNTLMLN